MKSDYAARAVLGLARLGLGGKAVRVDDLAGAQAVPANYLAQILLELKAGGLVKSVRGKEGGYLLARPAAEISLGDLLRCVHGQVFESPALADPSCSAELRRMWAAMQDVVAREADSITFQRLLEEGQDKEKMYYI